MRPMLEDGRLQVTAAASLLDNSRLVEWSPDLEQFVPTPHEVFEFSIRRDVDAVFGRLMCWIFFSAGAEFLAKGLCLTRGVEIRREQEVPVHPTGGIQAWVQQFRNDWKSCGTMKTTHFGTLATLTRDSPKTKTTAALKQLCSKVGATAAEKDRLLAAYELLARTIRNRDAHAYVAKVRDAHFPLVPELFADCFNLLVGWLPGGPATLNSWRDEARSFIASL